LLFRGAGAGPAGSRVTMPIQSQTTAFKHTFNTDLLTFIMT
jgi:hypothetical protein